MKAEQVVKLVDEYKAAGTLLVRTQALLSLATKSGDSVALSCSAADARLLASCIEARRSELQAYLEGRASVPSEPETPAALSPVEPEKKRPKVKASVIEEWNLHGDGGLMPDEAWQEWATEQGFKWGSVRNVLNELRRAAPVPIPTPDPRRAQVIDLGVALGAVKPTNPAGPAPVQPNAQEA